MKIDLYVLLHQVRRHGLHEDLPPRQGRQAHAVRHEAPEDALRGRRTFPITSAVRKCSTILRKYYAGSDREGGDQAAQARRRHVYKNDTSFSYMPKETGNRLAACQSKRYNRRQIETQTLSRRNSKMPSYVITEKCDGCKAQDKTACQYICPNDLMTLNRDTHEGLQPGAGTVLGVLQLRKDLPAAGDRGQGLRGLRSPGRRTSSRCRGTDSIMWTIKFRNGKLKRFKFPIRTTPEGSVDPYKGKPEADYGQTSNKPGILHQAAVRPMPEHQEIRRI